MHCKTIPLSLSVNLLLWSGMGIGLMACKRLIELMGGAIGVESTVGKGRVFRIDLVAGAAPKLATSAACRTAYHVGGARQSGVGMET
jgi:hypothetical protein